MAAFYRKPLRRAGVGPAKLFHLFDDEHFDGPPGTETEQIFCRNFEGAKTRYLARSTKGVRHDFTTKP